jgi:filamentous hemagglutinin
MNVDLYNRQLHEDEKRVAKKMVSDAKARGVRNADGSLITVDQIENAMRAANNDQYGEFVASGVVMPLNADTKASDLYDTTGMQLKTDGSGHRYLVQDPSMQVAPTQTLQDLIVRNTGGANSPYSWNPPSTQTSTTPRLDPHGPFTPARNGCITAECAASVAPVGKINPNGMDYVSVQGNFYVASGGLSVNLHDGSLFWTVAQGRPYPAPSLKPGFSITAGSIFGGATAKGTNEFLSGGGAGASTFLPLASPLSGIGGGVSHSYGGSTAIEIGIGTPGVSVNPITYGQPKRAEE